MATKKKQRIQSVRGFIKKTLHKRNALVDMLVKRVNELEEDLNLEYWAEEPDEGVIDVLEAKLTETSEILDKACTTNIVLRGNEWKGLIKQKPFGDFTIAHYLDGIPVVFAYRSELDSNEKYRLGWWVGGEMMLFPLMSSGRKRRPVTIIDRDDKSMYPCLKKVMVSEPSAAKNPIDSRFLWDRNERRGD